MTNFFEAAARHKPIKRKPQERRLYYNDMGQPIAYTNDELEGNYIIVDKQTFAECRKDVIIKDGKIHKLHSISNIYKLVPADKGTECDAEDITVIGTGQHWTLKKYETD